MKKTVIIIISLCVLLCSCNTANAKTLSSVASSATTLTQELETVRDSGGAVTADELLELDTVVVIKKADVFWCAATEKEYSSPWAAETTNSFSSEHATNIMNNYQEMGLCSAIKYTLNDDGVEYEVICTLAFENAEQNISEPSVVFYTKNIATGEVFYDGSVFEDAEITPVQPETEIEQSTHKNP